MRRLCGSPFCGPALARRAALVIQPREIRRAFRHESVVPQRIRVAIAHPTSIAAPRRHVPSVIIDLRDNQKACPGSSLHDREASRESSYYATPECRSHAAATPHLPFPLGRSGNRIAPWPMTISQRAGVTGTVGGGG